MTNEEIIEEAIKILKNKDYHLERQGFCIDVPQSLEYRYLFSLSLEKNTGRLLLKEYIEYSIQLKEKYVINLSPDFAPNMDKFVFLLRLKYPEFYAKWAAYSKF